MINVPFSREINGQKLQKLNKIVKYNNRVLKKIALVEKNLKFLRDNLFGNLLGKKTIIPKLLVGKSQQGIIWSEQTINNSTEGYYFTKKISLWETY